MFGIFIMASKKAHLFVVDRVRTNQMPTMSNLYRQCRSNRLELHDNYPLPDQEFTFDVRVDTEARRVGL